MSRPIGRPRSQNPDVSAQSPPMESEGIIGIDLALENSDLRAEVERLRAAVRASTEVREPSYVSHDDSSKDESFRPKRPDEFKGDNPSALPSFLVQLSMYFDSRPRQFLYDQSKILFAALLFQDAAARWWTAEYRKPPADRAAWTIDYQAFTAELERVFGRADAQADAQRKLSSLKQDRSASEYYTRFLQYASESEFNEVAQMYHFRHGLKTEIKTALAASLNQYTSLSELANAAILIDNHLYEDRRDRRSAPIAGPITGNRTSTSLLSRTRPQFAPRMTRPTTTTPIVRPATRFPSTAPSVPRGPLTDTEKQRRRNNNLCMYCGGSNHIAATCPNKIRVAAVRLQDKSNPGAGKD